MLKLALKFFAYLFIIILPFQVRYIFSPAYINGGFWDASSFSFYLSQIILGIVIILGFFRFIQKRKHKDLKYFEPKIYNFLILTSSFILFLIINLFLSSNRIVSSYWLIFWGLGFLFFIVLVKVSFTPRKFAYPFIISGVIQGVFAIVQFINQKVIGSSWLGMSSQDPSMPGVSVIESIGRWLRAYGTFPHPNFLGGFCAVCLLFLVGLYITESNNKKIRLFCLTSLPFILSGLLLSFSRAAWLGFGLTALFIVYFFFTAKAQISTKPLKQIILIIAAVSVIYILIYPEPFFTRFDTTKRLEARSLQDRSDLYGQAQKVLENNWVKGVGLGNYTYSIYTSINSELNYWEYQPVHNVYVLALTELGLVGFILYILFFWEVLQTVYSFKVHRSIDMMEVFKDFNAKNLYKDYQLDYAWFVILSMIALFILIINLFDHYLWTQYSGIIVFWLVMGLWANQRKMLKD